MIIIPSPNKLYNQICGIYLKVVIVKLLDCQIVIVIFAK